MHFLDVKKQRWENRRDMEWQTVIERSDAEADQCEPVKDKTQHQMEQGKDPVLTSLPVDSPIYW